MNYTLPINTTQNALELVGGKGRSLAQLSHGGFSVPGGFCVTTSAYRSFVAVNNLQAHIVELAVPTLQDTAVSFEDAASNIQRLFSQHNLSPAIEQEIITAYNALPGEHPAMAVRSSATAEDLPGMSFAGQQETYLNICGADQVVAAVRQCWASLWTPQAINYRHEMGVAHHEVAMAVVVQIMVPSDVSGVLFTANPASGERSEIIVNASFGLGEALVSGQVTPDTYVIDRDTLNLKESAIGAKAQKAVSDGCHGIRFEAVPHAERGAASISTNDLLRLSQLGIAVETHFGGTPQDVEWAIHDGVLSVLQARPITNLPPPPLTDVRWEPIAGAQLIKRQVAEHMQEPLSPLFEDLYLPALYEAQQWPDHKNVILATVNGYAYQRLNDEGFRIGAEAEARPLLIKLPALAKGYYQFYARSVADWRDICLPAYQATIERWRLVEPGSADDTALLQGIRELTKAEAAYWIPLRFVIGVAKMTDMALQQFLERHAPDQGFTSGAFLSGFDSRTLQAEAAIQAIASQISVNDNLRHLVLTIPVRRLMASLREYPGTEGVLEAIASYLETYGHQVYNLDFVETPQAEDVLPFLVSLKMLVQHGGSPVAGRQAEVSRQRRENLRAANRYFRGTRWVQWRFLLWMARHYYPYREEAFFYLGAAWAVLRPLALALGARLATGGSLARADDVFYLTSAELDDAIRARQLNETKAGLAAHATSMRMLRAARSRLNQPQAIPPMTGWDSPLSTVRDNSDDSLLLRGFAVSPGIVTGEVSVILTPGDFDQMKPGTILVCPFTTPAWTLLFPQAIGLATDIGSILAHGSIVAREFGIPAVLGIGDVTQRVRNGQRVTIDGNRGLVRIEED